MDSGWHCFEPPGWKVQLGSKKGSAPSLGPGWLVFLELAAVIMGAWPLGKPP